MSDLNRIRKLAGILTEGVMAVPGVGNSESDMQTAGTAARGSDYAAFDAAQPGIDEMFDNVEEKAPPGMEDVVMDLKKEYPGEPEKAFATAWSIYNKKHGKTEEAPPGMEQECSMMEGGADDETVQQVVARLTDMSGSFMSHEEAVDALTQELQQAGHSDEDIAEILNAAEAAINGDGDDEEDDGYCTACNGSGEGQYDGSRCSSCGGRGVIHSHDPDDFDEPDPDDYDPADDIYEETEEESVDEEQVDEAFDLNNGYDDIQFMAPGDFFPDGADGPVTSTAGPSGARMGDNDEQKKMAVAETHKELVYNYRKFLKESTKK